MAVPELIVTVQDERTVRVRQEETGAEETVEIERDLVHRALIEIFEDWLNRGKISSRRELEAFGSLLYRWLFRGEVGTFFEKAREAVPTGQHLRVQLSFQEPAAVIAGWPWEYLYFPDRDARRGFFLSTSTDLVLSRYMPLNSERLASLQPPEGTPRILIVVSQPNDLPPVVAEPVIEAIEKLKERHLIEIRVFNAPTVGGLVEALEQSAAHIVHFIGHGRYDRAVHQGDIALLNPGGGTYWCPDRDFADHFAQLPAKPRLVFLHMCESAVSDFTANFAGVAPQLIRAEIPAVVAMQHPITNQAAIAFSRAFYAELAGGGFVDRAVQMGRRRITIDDPGASQSRVFGTPVLHLSGRDSIIMPASTGVTGQSAHRAINVTIDAALDVPPMPGRAGETPQPNPLPDLKPPLVDAAGTSSSTLSEFLVPAAISMGNQYLAKHGPNDPRGVELEQRFAVLKAELTGKSVDEVILTLADWGMRERDVEMKEALRLMMEYVLLKSGEHGR